MADISRITLPSGDTYDLKDRFAIHESPAEPSSGMILIEDGDEGSLSTDLTVSVVPSIGRRGDVGPTNPRPLTGYTSLGIHHSGKNLFDKNNYTKLSISCTATSGATTGTVVGVAQQVAWMQLPGGVTYAISCSTRSSTAFRVIATAEYPVSTNEYKTPILLTISDASAETILFSAPADTKWIGFTLRTNSATDVTSIDSAVAGLQVEVASSVTAYESFQGTHSSISVPSDVGTLYAGVYDALNGKLTVTHLYKQFDGTESWTLYGSSGTPYFCYTPESSTSSTGWVWCSHLERALLDSSNSNIGICTFGGSNKIGVRPGSDIASTTSQLSSWISAQATAGTPLQVVYPLVTPIEYAIGSLDISLLNGINRIWSDCGDITVAFASGAYGQIVSECADIRALISDTERSMVASQSYSVGQYFSVGNKFYKVTQAISAGGTITPGTNVTATTIANELASLISGEGVSF